jgi:hypothetical protein
MPPAQQRRTITFRSSRLERESQIGRRPARATSLRLIDDPRVVLIARDLTSD